MTRRTRREFLRQCAAASASLSVAPFLVLPEQGKSARRPNVLWLISEDTSPDMGCYGNRSVQTPCIDKLAGQGVRFTNAFVTGPVCSAISIKAGRT